MKDFRIRVEVDHDADAAYIALSDGVVANTVEIAEHIMLDLDEYRVVVGIEVIRLAAQIPFSQLSTEYHVRSEVLEELRRIQPSISGFLSVTSGTDSTLKSGDRWLTAA
ncbi:DUF2283 domain-containing protein [Arthrobacter sp. TMS1-12-1]